jgi:pyruvate,water dikinase
MQRWLPLARFDDPAIAKVDNLRRAAAAGLRVPPTCWLVAADAADAGWPDGFGDGPLIVRSGAPAEDGRTTSNAGQLLSLIAPTRADFAAAVRRVTQALPPGSVVFVQPVVAGDEAGVAFFDGFYYERSLARSAGGRGALNVGLTAGRERGEVTRGYCERDDPWSEWLSAVYAAFGHPRGEPRIDVEWSRVGEEYVLLQVRPALFALRRNYLLTQANSRETLGEFPSPLAASSLTEACRDMACIRDVDPVFGTWEEDLAVVLHGRVWLNMSVSFRYTDLLGLPRTVLSWSTCGLAMRPADGRVLPGQLLAQVPRLARGLWLATRGVWASRRRLAEMDAAIAAARNLPELFAALVRCWSMAVYAALSIVGLCYLSLRLRNWLGLASGSEVVTRDLMEGYRRLHTLPDAKARLAALDVWLGRHGHRGPSESDVARPRFAEMREVLLADLAQPAPSAPPPRRTGWRRLLRPLFVFDEYREWYRDEWMRRWARLRTRLLEEGARLAAAGELDAAEDVFWLSGEDLRGSAPLRQAAAAARERQQAARGLHLPLTATSDEIEALASRAQAPAASEGQRVFAGIALDPAVVEGTARKADDLAALLAELGRAGGLAADTILVVPTLEPSWAVLFPRVAGVVAEVGGELSHASILLREAGRPAVVNVTGIWAAVRTGGRLRLDGRRGVVELVSKWNADDADLTHLRGSDKD